MEENVTSMSPPLPDAKRAAYSARQRKVVLLSSERYAQVCARLPAHKDRDILTHALLEVCLVRPLHLQVIHPALAKAQHMCEFHEEDYVHFLEHPQKGEAEKLSQYGLEGECQLFDHLWEYCRHVVGASVHAAHLLCSGKAHTALNFGGGRHHARKDHAEGYCFVNDVVLAIQYLMQFYHKVLYIDMDVHHSDGVEEAFYFSNRVFHISFHKFAPGFYPGTGSHTRTGEGPGKWHNINIPLNDGLCDATFKQLFQEVVPPVVEKFQPQVVVLQCGADTLSRDPIGTFNLTDRSITLCVQSLVQLNRPLLILGGGGYHPTDTARCWVKAAAAALGDYALERLPQLVPDHIFLPRYGPDFTLSTPCGSVSDRNLPALLSLLSDHVQRCVSHIPTPSPSFHLRLLPLSPITGCILTLQAPSTHTSRGSVSPPLQIAPARALIEEAHDEPAALSAGTSWRAKRRRTRGAVLSMP